MFASSTRSAMAPAPSALGRWYPPRDLRALPRWRWRDGWRWCRHRSGSLRRDLKRRLVGVEIQIRDLSPLDDASLQAALEANRLAWYRSRRKPAGRSRTLRERALALVAVAAQRTLGMSPYGVQLLASIALLEGCAVQMAPGEGKTLSIALAAVLHGWSGRPCHVITANDYLARRDAESLAPLYRFCALKVSAVAQDTPPTETADCYGADIVYATGKQLLADFLRDHLLLQGAGDSLRRRLWELRCPPVDRRPVMRGLGAAIVDEADSVLIDEAITPLIISAPDDNRLLLEAVQTAREIVDELVAADDYVIDEDFRDVHFSPGGERHLDALTHRLSPLWRVPERRHDLISQAIIARDLFHRDRHYVVDDGKVVIVDENTGRVMPGRSWSYGLHQAIEAREGVAVTHPSKTMARMSFQNFFRCFHHLSGASGTLHGIGRELWSAYRLPVIRVPTRLPRRLRVARPRHCRDREEKREALLREVCELQARGVPVLVGTRRIEDSEILAAALRTSGIDCVVLNAKQHEHEAEVVAMAGTPGRVTVATNMAGRGTDIKLEPGVAELGGLQVLMFEPHESARVDWQLFGRTGRQGAPGRAHPFVELDDDQLRRHLPWVCRPLWWLARVNAVRPLLIGPLMWLAQQRAQWRAWLQRRRLQRQETQINKQLSFLGERNMAAGLLDPPE